MITKFYFLIEAKNPIVEKNMIAIYRSSDITEPKAICAGPINEMIIITQITQTAAEMKFLALDLLSSTQKKNAIMGSKTNNP